MTVSGGRVREALRSPRTRLAARLVVGLGSLVAVIAYVGTGPFLHGILSIDLRTVAAAAGLAAVATAAAAWRWRVIATRLGVELSWGSAIARYYQSQFLNTVVPGGVVGDVHRAVGRDLTPGSIPANMRAVVLERTVGQVVQVAVSLAVLAWFGAKFEGYLLIAVTVTLAGLGLSLLVAVRASARARMALRREARELRAGLGSVGALTQVALASALVIACHVATLAIATAAVGAQVAAPTMIALALVILLGASVPLNIGGWGPREGIAGWAFALAGFGASAGVAASTLFGVLTAIAVAPGAIISLAVTIRATRARAEYLPAVTDHTEPHSALSAHSAHSAQPARRQEQTS